jgi:hypothetical protein
VRAACEANGIPDDVYIITSTEPRPLVPEITEHASM